MIAQQIADPTWLDPTLPANDERNPQTTFVQITLAASKLDARSWIDVGTEVAARTLLEGNGISYDDFRPQRLNFNETASALRDGNIDAGFLSAGPPTSAIMDLATARRMQLVPIGAAEVENTSVLDPTVIRDFFLPGTYPGQEFEVETLSTPNLLVVRADMSEELVYDLIEALYAVRTELAGVHPAARHISAEYTLEVSPIPLHPGAVRYFLEAGYEVPDRLILSP